MTSVASVAEYMAGKPYGATRAELCGELRASISHIGKIIDRLMADGALVGVTVGGAGKDVRTKRYYSIKHAPSPLHRTKQRTAPMAAPFVDGEARVTSETKVTIAPPFVDRRFKFDAPPGWKGAVTEAWEAERGL